MLDSVGSSKNYNRDAQLHRTDRLTEQIEEIGKVRNGTDIDRLTVDDDLSIEFILQYHIIEVAFNVIRHDTFLQFSHTILLLKVDALIPDEESTIFRQELLFDPS